MPLVSIIVPSYNYDKYIGAAIESALAQTYENIEVIVADDGSVDNSVNVARKYHVKVIKLKHMGLAGAFRRGVEASKGEFLLNLNSDDILHPSYVKETLAALEEDSKIAYAYTQMVGFGAGSYHFESCPFSLKMLLKRPAYFPATALIRKSAFLEAGGYDARLPFHEDWDFWLKLAENGEYGVLMPKPLLFYRQHAGQLGTKAPWAHFAMRHRIRGMHRELFAANLGARDWLDIFASDCGLFAYMAARDVFTALRVWEPVRRGMVRIVAALQPGYAYANEVPESCRQLIKRMDSERA